MKPRLLDLFCGAGGAAVGYSRAGFEVVGVDIKPQPHYPFPMWELDALTALQLYADDLLDLGEFDAIHASPPCQRWTRSSSAGDWPDLVTPVRELIFAALDCPYVIENVPRAPLRNPAVLCGSSFGLRVRRHRAFETSFPVFVPPCAHNDDFITVAGGGPNPASFRRGPNATGGPDRKPANLADALDAMGVDWRMTRAEVNEAIPPAFTEFIGYQLMQHIQARVVA